MLKAPVACRVCGAAPGRNTVICGCACLGSVGASCQSDCEFLAWHDSLPFHDRYAAISSLPNHLPAVLQLHLAAIVSRVLLEELTPTLSGFLQINSRGLDRQTAATGQAAQEVEDLIEESPAPLQERPEAAAQEMAGSPKLGRGKQRKQLRKIHTANESDAGVAPNFTVVLAIPLYIYDERPCRCREKNTWKI